MFTRQFLHTTLSANSYYIHYFCMFCFHLKYKWRATQHISFDIQSFCSYALCCGDVLANLVDIDFDTIPCWQSRPALTLWRKIAHHFLIWCQNTTTKMICMSGKSQYLWCRIIICLVTWVCSCNFFYTSYCVAIQCEIIVFTGQPVIIPYDRQQEMLERTTKQNINVVASEIMSLNRTYPDMRHPK